MKNLIISLICFFNAGMIFAQKTLQPSDEGSRVHFVIKNFGIKTGGDFSGLKGSIKFDLKNIADWQFDVTVNSATINTDNDTRDGHLKKSAYFDVATYPTIQLLSSTIKAGDKPGNYIFVGNLKIKGISKPIQFPFKVNTSNGGYLFTGDFEINRRDFAVGASSVSLADNLKVSLSVFAK